VSFNGVSAVPSAWSNSSITVAAPSATTGLVVVTVGGVSSNGISFSFAPSISSVSPSSGPTGTSVTIGGQNFGAMQGQSTVTFGGTAAAPTSWGPSRIVVPVPSTATTGLVIVIVAGQSSNGITFTVGTGSITGTVTRSSDGTAVSGASVQALVSNAVQGSATTAADGTYTIGNLYPGSYDVRVTASGYGTTILAGNNVGAGTPTTINVSLGLPGTVSGKITQSDGVTAFVGATITALQGTETSGTATSDSSGNYSISTLAAGSYSTQVSASGYKTQTQSGVSVSSGNTTTVNFSLSGQSVITYDYDELGRLVGAADSLGDAAGYSYDAVGNVLAISRNHSNQTAILYFTPQSGPVGTIVTISGTGFSTNSSQDTVVFHGTNATVNSATPTQILTSVPTAATSGPITVTTPNGTATSSTSFNLTSGANGAPTISSFTPTLGAPGTAVAISGTNFDVQSNDRTKFNVGLAGVNSATSTSISATVPLTGTSGHVSISTPNGNAVSSGDFFVPPPGYTASSVVFTGRMTTGGSFTGSIGASGQIGLVVFDGTAGRKVSLTATAVTLTGGTITINNPNGTALASTSIITSSTFLDATTLPTTGTYTIVVVGSSAGSLTLNLYDIVDFQGAVTPGGPTVTVSTVPAQNAYLTFSGTFGQQLGINLTSGSYAACNLTLYSPTGSTVTSASCGGATDTIAPVTLMASGTYQILIDPQGAASGSVTVQVTSVLPVTGTITPGGPPVTVTTTQQTQDAALTFTGTTGQRVSLLVNNVTNPSAYVYLVKPDGTSQTYIGISTGCNCFMDVQTQATAGTYTLWVQHISTYVGSETLQLYNVPADATGTIMIGGSPVSVTTTVPGQNASLTFSGTSGQRVSMNLTSGSYSSCYLTLKNPDGTTLTSGSCSGATGFVDTAALGQTGTYTIFIDPQGVATGGVTVQLNNDSDVTGTITAGGSPVTVTTTVVGQDARLTFSGTVGQRVSLAVTNVTNPTAYVYLVKPDGTNQTYTYISTSCNPCFMDTQTLGTTGTYTLWVQHNSTYVGSETLQLYNVPADATGTITIGGSPVSVTTTVPGQNASLTFSGTSGQSVTISITSGSYSSCFLYLKNPDGTTLTSGYCSGTTDTVGPATLGTSGTFTIFIDPQGTATGGATVQLTGH
jgi:YD repeat-containing protein